MEPDSTSTFRPGDDRVVAVWRKNGRREGTIRQYLCWIRRYEGYCGRLCRSVDDELTLAGADAFARWYAEARHVRLSCTTASARSALHAWNFALSVLGQQVPRWRPAATPPLLEPLVEEFCRFRRHHAGVAESTNHHEANLLAIFLETVCVDGRSPSELRVVDVDRFVSVVSPRWGRKTLARACTTIRAFLRFLHCTGRLAHDVASAVTSPVVRIADRPPRALPWADVQSLLKTIDTTNATGRRDYALFLMMATYGMGAAEVLHLQPEDIDWRAGTLRLVRPKTGVETLLPLIPAVGEALVSYLRNGRPQYPTTRAIFVAAVEPHGAMTGSALRYAIRVHARAAGLRSPVLGGHVLRHSHACRQVELGSGLKVVGDILGHRDPSSTSAYVRVAIERLRALALKVPQ